MIEAGAASVHFEDQLASEKKCGHMGGKVLVPTRHFERTLAAARLAADVLGVPTVLVARTDALSGALLQSDIDERDREFLTGERTSEGFYRVRNGIDAAIAPGLAYARLADVLWCETSTPDLDEARAFADAIHADFPGKLLAYNCSPSFNWRKHLDEDEIAMFQRELASMGYRFLFVTLAGFHALNASAFELANGYASEGMPAYVRLQEREFELEALGYTATRHQTEVGTGYFDRIATVVSGGDASTLGLRPRRKRSSRRRTHRRGEPLRPRRGSAVRRPVEGRAEVPDSAAAAGARAKVRAAGTAAAVSVRAPADSAAATVRVLVPAPGPESAVAPVAVADEAAARGPAAASVPAAATAPAVDSVAAPRTCSRLNPRIDDVVRRSTFDVGIVSGGVGETADLDLVTTRERHDLTALGRLFRRIDGRVMLVVRDVGQHTVSADRTAQPCLAHGFHDAETYPCEDHGNQPLASANAARSDRRRGEPVTRRRVGRRRRRVRVVRAVPRRRRRRRRARVRDDRRGNPVDRR